jgi:hypothetical protein
MSDSTKELVRGIGLPPRPKNRVSDAIAAGRPPRTRTETTTHYPQQGFVDRFLNGPAQPVVTTTEIPLTDLELGQHALEKQRVCYESVQLAQAEELRAVEHYGDLKEQEVRILSYEKIAAHERIEILDLHYRFDAGQRLWPQKEAAALAEVETQQLRAETIRVRAENELLKARLEQAALKPQPVVTNEEYAPRPRVFGERKSDDLLRSYAKSFTNKAVIGCVDPVTWDDRWLPRAGATFIESYMRTLDRARAEKDTYESILHNLRLENAGEIYIDLDQARGEFRHFLDLEEQARKMGYLDKIRDTFTAYNRPGGDDVFAGTNVKPIIDVKHR